MSKAGLTQSMSRKACPQDNAACGGFFGRIKNEMFYNRSWMGVNIKEFIGILDEHLIWYNESTGILGESWFDGLNRLRKCPHPLPGNPSLQQI
jgi:transposase InsO family protein